MTERTCDRLAHDDDSCGVHIPSGCVTLQIFALSLKHARPNLSSSRVVLARVFDIFESSQWYVRVHEVRIAPHEPAPLIVPRHGDGTVAQFLDGVVLFVGIALEDAGESIVCFLDFTDDNRFELAPGIFKVEVGLDMLDKVHEIRL